MFDEATAKEQKLTLDDSIKMSFDSGISTTAPRVSGATAQDMPDSFDDIERPADTTVG